MTIFAYGSNMDVVQMMHRCPAAKLLGIGLLRGQQFQINTDGVATLIPKKGGIVWGVLWALTAADELRLDVFEGVPAGVYRKRRFQITTTTALIVNAIAYVASNREPGFARPGYIEKILRAARTHGFPKPYFDSVVKFLLGGVRTITRNSSKADKRLAPVFAYGTLKQGFANHHLLGSSSFIGSAVTKEKFALYRAGIPYVCRVPQICQIHGEVFLVTAKILLRIDELEGHPHWYRREIVFAVLSSGLEVPAWMYFYPHPRGELFPSGEYTLNNVP